MVFKVFEYLSLKSVLRTDNTLIEMTLFCFRIHKGTCNMIFSFYLWFRFSQWMLVFLSLGPRLAPAVGRLAGVGAGHGAAHAGQLQTAAGHGDTCMQIFLLQLQIFLSDGTMGVWGREPAETRGRGALS